MVLKGSPGLGLRAGCVSSSQVVEDEGGEGAETPTRPVCDELESDTVTHVLLLGWLVYCGTGTPYGRLFVQHGN